MLILLLPAMFTTAKADELTLTISLGLSQQQAMQTYQPVVDYLSQAIGQPVRLELSVHTLAHWQLMRREGYDLILDGPAFVAYRAAKMGHTVLAKMPDVLSFTLVAHVDQMLFEPAELIGRMIATQPSPSLGALNLAQLYTNPMRQPDLLQVDTHQEAAQAVLAGRAVGAMLPSQLVSSYSDLVPIHTAAQVPAPAFSASGRVTPEQREALRLALLNAHNSPAGRAMLEALNVPRFEAASNATYAGLETMLEGLWGY